MQACKTESQLKTAISQNPNADGQTNASNYFGAENSIAVIASAKTFAFAPTNAPTDVSIITSIKDDIEASNFKALTTVDTIMSMPAAVPVTISAHTSMTAEVHSTTIATQEETAPILWGLEGVYMFIIHLIPL